MEMEAVSNKYFIRYRNVTTKGPFVVYGGVNSDFEPVVDFTLEGAREMVKNLLPQADFLHWRIQPIEEVATTDPRIEDYMGWMTYDWYAERPDKTAQDLRLTPGTVKVLIVRNSDGTLDVHAATEAVYVMIVDRADGSGEEQAQAYIFSPDEIDRMYDKFLSGQGNVK